LVKCTYAFVFARGGSKGLPKKNILKINNIPLVAYGIIHAKKIKEIKSVFVSSDCPEIGKIAKEYGAEWIKRPPELASDTSSEWLAWQHAIRYVIKKKGKFNCFLSLPATSPLRSIEDIEKGLAALKNNVDLVVSMVRSKRSPWFNMVTKYNNDNIKLLMNNTSITRRQDSPLCYDLTTAFYVGRTEFILNTNNFWEGKVAGVEIPEERAIDIDNKLDFQIAEYIANKSKLIN
jgi:N-acylneuraminate cytidylyltransferase